MTQLVDWDLAVSTARRLSRSGPAISASSAAGAVAELKREAETAVDAVAEYTGLVGAAVPAVRVVDRVGWSAANVAGLSSVLEPLADKIAPKRNVFTQSVGSRVAGAQAGVVLAYLSGKVLGQYEIFGENYGRLLLVAPNIVEAERELKASKRDFRMWVCLHEAAHAAQFGGVEWLRPHFLTEIDEFASTSELDGYDDDGERRQVSRFVDQTRRTAELISDSIRDGDSRNVLDLLTSPAQRAVVDRLTAMMTLLEGHADYIMDAVGENVIDDVDFLRRGFDRRRESGGPFQRIARKMLGMDVKLKQYIQGKKFVEGVVNEAGMAGFNRVWERPGHLPTLDELESPDLWLQRVSP